MNATKAVGRLVVTQGDSQVASLAGCTFSVKSPTGPGCRLPMRRPCSGRASGLRGTTRARLLSQVAVMLGPAAGSACRTWRPARRARPVRRGGIVGHHLPGGAVGRRRRPRRPASSPGPARERVPSARSTTWSWTLTRRWSRVHSEGREGAASHFKGGYGFQPLFCFAEATRQRPGELRRRSAPGGGPRHGLASQPTRSVEPDEGLGARVAALRGRGGAGSRPAVRGRRPGASTWVDCCCPWPGHARRSSRCHSFPGPVPCRLGRRRPNGAAIEEPLAVGGRHPDIRAGI